MLAPAARASLHAFRAIKLSHTLFALPMALTGMLLASRGTLPPARVLLLILLCMVSGRSAAMGANRLIDAAIDAANPRTAMREIPRGILSRRAMALFVLVNMAAFLAGAALLNALTLVLAPVALAVFVVYPYTKRVTALCHFVLGLALGAAPVGAWIAVTGHVATTPMLLGAAVLSWVAGFDILYALADETIDRAHGLHSIPAALGGHRARWVARACHLAMILLLVLLGRQAQLGVPYHAGVAIAAALLGLEHWLVRKDDLAKLDTAFFTANSWLSVVLFAGTTADLLAL